MTSFKQIGQPLSRLEGPEKVTGNARYAADYQVPGMVYGYVVNSTVTKGEIKKLNTLPARTAPGVIEIFTHENRPSIAWFDMQYADMDAPPGSPFRPLGDSEIVFNGQPIALVVADTFEAARYAASLLEIEYSTEGFETDIRTNLQKARSPRVGMATMLKPLPPKPQGDFEAAYQSAFAKVEGEYYHGTEHHNPLEMFATTVVYEGDGKLTIYDKTQGTINSQMYVANVFGLKMKNVRVVAPYVGGAFGSGLRPQHQLFMATMAALELKRPVQVMLDRSQMFTFGHRPQTVQYARFAADENGTVTAMNHKAIAETSHFEDYTEVVVNWSHMLYPAKNTLMQYKLVELDLYSPLDMRAPGGSTGLHAIESAMDELSYKLKIDPLKLRVLNYSEKDVSLNRPYSSKELMQCYLQGAERFGWDKRNPEPRSMKRGNKLVGYGMATGLWEANTLPARAEAILDTDGKLTVNSAVTDIGTGTFTVMAQIAAEEMGVDIENVTFGYGDSKKPFAPIQGGSFTVSTVGSAIKAACHALKKKLLKDAKKVEVWGLGKADLEDVIFQNGKIALKSNAEFGISYADIISSSGGKPFKVVKFSVPNLLKLKKYSRATHSAAFVEVEVDEELGVINVTRALSAVAAGKIVNPKTARSQLIGGMIWGISKALREESIIDHTLGKFMNQNLSEYHIPVHADLHDIDAFFVEEHDEIVNELGTKGVGEIGLVAMPPAIANAIYHATGKRINDLPIHFDRLL